MLYGPNKQGRSPTRRSREVHDVFPLTGIGSRHDGNDRLRVAHVKDLMRHTRLNENEIPGFIFERMFERRSVLVPHAPGKNVEHYLELDVNVSVGDPSR